jgi:hypothetical protein
MFKKPSLEILKIEFLARVVLLVVTSISMFQPFVSFIQGRYYPFAFMIPAIFVIFLTIYSVFFFSPRLRTLAYYSVSKQKLDWIFFKPSLDWLCLIIWLVLSLFITSKFLETDFQELNNPLQITVFIISFLATISFNPVNLTLNLLRVFYSFFSASKGAKIWILLRVLYIFFFLLVFSYLAFVSLDSRFFYNAKDFFILINMVFVTLLIDTILVYFENGFLTKNKEWLKDL